MHLAPLGIRLQIYPAKGYSATFDVKDESAAPNLSLTDDEFKLVFSRIGKTLRVAGTAELNRVGAAGNPGFIADGRDTPTFEEQGQSYPLDLVDFAPWSKTPMTSIPDRMP